MAATFGDFIDNLLVEVDSLHPDKETYLRQAAVRALAACSRFRVLWAEGSFSFATVVDQQTYTSADSGFPVDALDFDFVYFNDSNLVREVERWSIDRVRTYATLSGGPQPLAYAYHARSLVLAPTPTKVVTIYGDYVQDARRDATTGNVIASTDEGSTNPWIDEGEDILRSRTLLDFYSSPMGSSPERAAEMRAAFGLAVNEARSRWHLLRASGFQAPVSL